MTFLSSWMPVFLLSAFFLLLEGFFSGSELALVSADKVKLTHRAAQGHRGAKIALALAHKPEWLFSTTLLGQNLFIVANSTLITFFISNVFGKQYELFGLFLSPVVLIFGEAVPKSIFQHWADRLAPLVSPILWIFSYVAYPIVWPLSRLTLLLMGGVQGSLMKGHEVTGESLEFLFRESEMARSISPLFKKSLLKILNFAKKEVQEVMTPLIGVFSLRENTLIEEAIIICREEGYSSIPVFQRRAYNIVGVIALSDLLFSKDTTAPLSSLMETPLYVPATMGVRNLFLFFRDQKKSFAIVVDEYGAAVGVVTLEDIIEEIVGEIEDEYDEAKVTWKKTGPAQFLFSGRVTIDEINEKLHWGLPSEDYETLAGFLLSELQHFPQTGEVFKFGNLTFLIKSVTPRSIDEILAEIG